MNEIRVINSGSHSEAMHHAIDQVLLEQLENGDMKPTIRFWYRENPSVPFGRFQSYRDEVETEYANENDIEVVRRITGGGAMFCEPGNVITYSLYLPKEEVQENIQESYRELDTFARDALKRKGVDAGYEPLNDITHPDGKLGGAAQLRKDNAVLHHTTLSYDLDIKKMLKVLRIGKEKVSDKAIKSTEKRVSRIADHTDSSREEIIEDMIGLFTGGSNSVNKSLTENELEKAKKLAEDKFSTQEWNRKL